MNLQSNGLTITKIQNGHDGQPGQSGSSYAMVYLYKRSDTATPTTAPAKPTGTVRYEFSNGTVSGDGLNGWSNQIPDNTVSAPCYMIVAQANAAAGVTFDEIASTEWSSATEIVKDGTNGTNGTNGYNQATIYLYKRIADDESTAGPNGNLKYYFSNAALTGSYFNGWSRGVPANDTVKKPCWVTTAAAVSRKSSLTISSTAWSSATKMVEDGINGAQGVSITGVLEEYAINNSSSTAPTSNWSSAQTPPTSSNRYLWNREVVSYSDGNTDTTTPHIAAMYSQDGKGISSVTNQYAINNDSSTAPTSGWQNNPIPPTEENKYLWNKETINYTSGNPTTTTRIIGTFSKDGKDGVTITGTIVEYQQGDSGTTPPTGTWSTTMPSIADQKYLWTRTTVSYSDSTPDTVSYSVSYKAKNGANGTSVTITSKSVTYQKSDSGTTTPTGTWSSTIPAVEAGKYLWTRTIVNYSDNNSTTAYSVSRMGTNGADGNNYIILYYYQRGPDNNPPTKPSGTYTYNFLQNVISPDPETTTGWTMSIPPTNPNHDACYVTTISFLGNTTSVSGASFTDPVKLVEDGADGKDANSLRVSTSVDQVLRFPQMINAETGKIIYDVVPDTIDIYGFLNEQSLTTNDFTIDISLNDVRLINIIEDQYISDYIKSSAGTYYEFCISQLNKDKADTDIIKANTDPGTGTQSKDENLRVLDNFFTSTESSSYITVKISYNDGEYVAYKYLSISTGTGEDAARLSIKAGGIYASVANAKLTFDENGLTIKNGGIKVYDNNNDVALTFDEESRLLTIIGDIRAKSGYFSGELRAATGSFSGEITANSGEIGGFTITQNSITASGLTLSSNGNGGNSQIDVDNILLGSGAQVKPGGQITVGENLIISDPTNANNNTVFALTKDGDNYFSINNNGDINGYNWSIKKDGDEIVASFDRLVTTNGNFKGHIEASDITAGTISASTIETASFVTERIRSMGGAFIFRPVSNIASNGISNYNTTNKQIKIILDQSNFVNNYIKVGDTIIISGNLNSNNNTQDNINSQNLTGGSNYYAIVNTINTANNFIIVTPINPNHYSTILAQANLQDENALISVTVLGQDDILIGINSDKSPAGNILPQRGLVMEAFKHSVDNSRHYFNYDVKLFLGDFQALSDKNLIPNSAEFSDGWGLYADNVYLKGSLVTEQVQSGSNNSTFAGVSTRTNATVKVEDEDERIMFWAGAHDVSNINESPFIVTEKGTILAKKGIFEGTVLSNVLITESTVRTPAIYGVGKDPSLKIVNTNPAYGGISFYLVAFDISQYNDEIQPSDMTETLRITSEAFSYIKNNNTTVNFISFTLGNNNNKYVNFYGNLFKADEWSLTTEGITYKNNLRIAADNNSILRVGISEQNRIYFDDGGIDLQTNAKIRNQGTVQFYNTRTNTTISMEYTIRDTRYCLFVQEA